MLVWRVLQFTKRLFLIVIAGLYVYHRITDKYYLTGDVYKTILNIVPVLVIALSAYVIFRSLRRHVFASFSRERRMLLSVGLSFAWLVFFLFFPIQIWGVAVCILLFLTSFDGWDKKRKEKTTLAPSFSTLLAAISMFYPLIGMIVFHAQDPIWMAIGVGAALQSILSLAIYYKAP